MIYMTMEQAEEFGLFDHPINTKVVILSEADMAEHLRKLLA